MSLFVLCSLGSLPSIFCTVHWGHWHPAVSLQDTHSWPSACLRGEHPIPVCKVSVWEWSLRESAEACATGHERRWSGVRLEGNQRAGRGLKREVDVSPSAKPSGRLKAAHFVTGPLRKALEGNGQWTRGEGRQGKQRETRTSRQALLRGFNSLLC